MVRVTKRNRRSSKKGRTRRGLIGGADEVDQSVVLQRCKGLCTDLIPGFDSSWCNVSVATSDFVASSKYLEWLGAGMSRLAYNSPLVALAMWTTLTRSTQPLIGGTTLSAFFDKLNATALCKRGSGVGAYTVDGWNENIEEGATKFVNGYYTEVFSKYLKKKPDILPVKGKLPDTFWDEDALRKSVAEGVETKDTNFEMVYVHTSEDLSCYLVADKKANAIFIVFRGSRSLSNWKKNFTVHTKAGCTDPCNVSHKLQCKKGERKEEMRMYPGFLGLDLEAIHTIVWMGAHLAKTVIGASPSKPARVFMFGHSLGGALATISSLLYSMMRAPGLEPADAKAGLKLLCPRVTCISYASPRPFNKAADECFNLRKDMGLISFARLFTAGDPVPTVAPWMDGAGTTDDKRKVKGSKALVAARVLTLGAAGVVSHAFEDGVNYTSLISARMQAVASELRKVAGGGCENKHLIFVELLGPIKPKSGKIPIEAAIRLLGDVGSQIPGTTSSGKACSEWVDEDIRSESSLSKDILDELKGVATTKGRLDVSGCLAHAQKKVGELKAHMEKDVHTAKNEPSDAAGVVKAQQNNMQICLPSAAAAAAAAGGGLGTHLGMLKKAVGAKASAAAASAKKGIEKAKGKLTKSPSTAPSEAAAPETPVPTVAQKHKLAPAQSDEARKRECIVSCQCGSRASQGGSKRSSSSARRERAGVIDLIDHLHARRASLERALRTTGKGSESTFLRTRKRGIDNELQRAHGLIATLDRSRQRRASNKTRRRPRGGGH